MPDSLEKIDKPELLLIGVRGQLGHDCAKVFAPGFSVTGLNSDELDLLSPEKIRAAVLQYQPAVIVNCAAYTQVDNCEIETETAYLINSEAPARMAAVAGEIGALLLHVSTDYVFPGNRPLPDGYTETDAVAPVPGRVRPESQWLHRKGEKECGQIVDQTLKNTFKKLCRGNHFPSFIQKLLAIAFDKQFKILTPGTHQQQTLILEVVVD